MCNLTDETNWYVILNQTSDAQSLPNFYLNDGTPVYSIWQGTPYAEWDDLKPYIAQIPPEHPFLNWIDTAPNDWGMLVSSDAELDEVLAHFRSLTQVWMPTGNHVFFKYYDPDFSIRIAQLCSEDQRSILMGPCKSWNAAERVENDNPRLGSEEKEFPWWSLPQGVFDQFTQEDKSALVINTINWIKESHADLYYAFPVKIINSKVTYLVNRYKENEQIELAQYIINALNKEVYR